MDRYDYQQAVTDDVQQYIEDNYTPEEIAERMQDRDEWEQELYDDMFVSDSVTGNASGSYTFNTWRAEEYLCHNMELLGEALQEFGCDGSYLEKGAEACDVTIRCYLLGQAISTVLDEIERVGIEGVGVLQTELYPRYDSRASFYGKAKVIESNDGTVLSLVSYNTTVATYDRATNTLDVFGYYSPTTARHIREFARQLDIELPSGRDIKGRYQA